MHSVRRYNLAIQGRRSACAELARQTAVHILRGMETPIEGERIDYQSYRAEWQGIGLEIRHCPRWFGSERDDFLTQHIEIRSDGRVVLPITETGYRSHFLNGAEALAEFDHDPVAFVLWWLDDAAQSKEWQAQVEASRQGSLF